MWRILLVLAVSVVLVGCPLGGRDTFDIWVVVNVHEQSHLDELTSITLKDDAVRPSVVVPLDISVLELRRTHVFKSIPLRQFPDNVVVEVITAGGGGGDNFRKDDIAGTTILVSLWWVESPGNLGFGITLLDDASADLVKSQQMMGAPGIETTAPGA